MSVVHPLIRQAQKNLPEKLPAVEKEFIRQFYAGASGSDLDLMDIITLQRTAAIHWAMTRERRAGKCSVRVHNPATEKGGWPLNRTVIDFVDDDRPFQIDSITAEITRYGQAIHLMVYPLLYIARNGDSITGISSEQDGKKAAQSHIHIELAHMLPEEQCRELLARITQVMTDVRYATSDWQDMRGKLLDCESSLNHAPSSIPAESVKECQAFLQYLYNDNFTLLGYREYAYVKGKGGKTTAETVKNSHLGLLRKEVKTDIMLEGVDVLPPLLVQLSKGQTLMRIFKLDRKSTVHRCVPLDAIMIRLFDHNGATSGEAVFIGLFTSVTYSRSIRDIPYLSRKTRQIMERSKFEPGTHGYKALSHILEKYPRDEMFQIDTEQLYEYALSIVRLYERQRIALYTRVDTFRRHISCLVYIPRERYDMQLRIKIQKILEEELRGTCNEFYMTLDDSPLSRLMFIVTLADAKVPEFDRTAIELRLQDACRAWTEQINEALYKKLTDDREIANLTARYGTAFPSAYRERYEAHHSVHDIFQIEKTLASNGLERHFYRRGNDDGHKLRLKLFRPEHPVVLSDILPILEKMGLRVIAELPFEIKPAGIDKTVWIQDLEMEIAAAPGSPGLRIEDVNDNFEDALLKVWNGTVENDSLNSLILTAGMTWRDIVILRSYVRYMRQGKTTFSTPYIEKALTDYPGIASRISGLFHARFNPGINRANADKQAEDILADIEKALNAVASLDQDRILRALTAMVDGTLRTNFFQKDENGEPKPWLSFKINSSVIPELPDPRPFREIWVYSPRMEGIHLRADRIARGGIRWSDRNEDFRTEVLGLMKAQQVKNAIIVPMGAKGGFVLKHPPAEGGRAALQEEGIECYKFLVRGMLDITDNRKGKKIVPPKDVVRRDDDDPYLVVAADKGTATFSDIANGLSAEYDFWLGDAFASGGSVGYDHKKMGITARGAWESVKRHFREMGTDTQTTDFDVIGVGDMAGDVFGNGMLLSEHIRLVGAFNHIHIVCDPNPDAKTSFAERERLFREVKGWDQYDAKLLSKGGRIFLRSEKSLHLTPEIMERFEIAQEKITPPDLMRAMLKAKTDLLWFGGIGTFVKAASETHIDVGDKANDAIRIDANEIRAKVMGEGANLGITQRGRVEFSALGGRLNADFIDNSGGVNSSDLEVNIKILMTDVINNSANKMDIKKRNVLLGKMTNEVAALVLRNSYQQAQGISLMVADASSTLVADAQFIRDLERDQSLKRKLENLPDDAEIERRRLAGGGLLRPEICILQSYAKIHMTREIMDSDIADQPEMQEFLITYFPKPLQDKYKHDILGHRLGREIIAMTIANGIVNRMGASFTKSHMDATGMSCADVIRAFIIVREALGLRGLWDRIEELNGNTPATTQLNAMIGIRETASRAVTWFLTRLGRNIDLSSDIPSFTREIDRLKSILRTDPPAEIQESVNLYKHGMIEAGLPESLAHELALLTILDSGFDIVRIALDNKADLAETARTYFEIGAAFNIRWLRREAENLPAPDRWSQESRDSLINHLYRAQAGLVVRALKESKAKVKAGKEKAGIVPLWLASHEAETLSVQALLETVYAAGPLDMARLVVAVQRLDHLAGE